MTELSHLHRRAALRNDSDEFAEVVILTSKCLLSYFVRAGWALPSDVPFAAETDDDRRWASDIAAKRGYKRASEFESAMAKPVGGALGATGRHVDLALGNLHLTSRRVRLTELR